MRLVCPNCDAEYQVDDAAIPQDGRDVQCSSCGHAWFQGHPEIEADLEAEAELYEAPPGAVSARADLDEPDDGGEPAEGDDDGPGEDARVAPKRPAQMADRVPSRPRTLDETVLSVLREEAEREQNARTAERAPAPAPVIESQTEMGLAPTPDPTGMVATVRRIARIRGGTDASEPKAAGQQGPAQAERSRGQRFPAIEEINSTLRATGDRVQDDDDDALVDSLPDLAQKRRGFRRGFLTLIVLAVLIVGLYLLAPMIGATVPALDAAATTYVGAVDAARVWLDANLWALISLLRGIGGNQG